MNATISIALIVRNSSATLDKCLSTFKEVADEIVVVDTGSTDNTVEIAQKYTDKLYFFEWIDDFSAARNYSFDQCTKDFIFWCFHPQTQIHTEDGFIPIDKIKIGDRVLTHKGTYKKVTKVYEQDYSGSVYDMETYFSINGIVATPNHEFYASKGLKCKTGVKFCAPTCRKQWSKRYLKTSGNLCRQCKQPYKVYSFKFTPIEELEIGDILAFPRLKQTIFDSVYIELPPHVGKQIPKNIEITPEFMRLIGYYVAEGTYGKGSFSFCFNINETEYHNDVSHLMEKYFHLKGNKRETPQNGCSITYCSVVVSNYLYEILNGTQYTRCLPSSWLGLSDEHIAQFLKGYYRGDGGDSSDSFNFTSISFKLIIQVREMLTRFGILSHTQTYETKRKRAWRTSVGGDVKLIFEKVLGEKHPWKPESHLRRNKHYYSDADYIYYPIKKISKKNYIGKVYNLEVLDDHTYVVDSALCHNCDSDDYLLPEDAQKIKDLDFSDKDIVVCNYEYAHDEFGASICTVPRERIVRRSLGLKWQDEIHEYLPLNGRLFTSDISTHHNKQHGTSERNLAILEKVVQRNPSSRNLYYLGKEYFEMGRFDDGIVYLERFVNHPDGWWEDRYQAYYKLASSYMSKGDEAKFKEYIYKSIAIEERWAEPYNLLGLYYLNKQEWDKSIFWYEAALKVRRPKGLLAYYQPEYYTWLPNLNLALAYNAVGDLQNAYDHNKKVLEYRPNDSRALNNNKILSDALTGQKKAETPKKDGQGKKLNLGCGNKPVPGYVNVDLFKGPIVDEIFSLDDIPYTDGTISAIHSEHALEHLPFKRAENAIKEWFRVLAPGGELLLKIPDLDGCCRSYVDSLGDKFNRWWYKATLYGIQESQAGEADESQIHQSGFSQEEIAEVLERNGFVVDKVEKYDGYRTPSLDVHAFKGLSKVKVGWLAPMNWEAAQTRIRVLRVNDWLKSHGYMSEIVTGSYNDVVTYNFDVAVVGKSFSAQDIDGIKMLKQQGKTVYADICEDLREFPYFKETLAECDKVICCSDALAEVCRPINSNVVVIEDAFETA